MNCTVSVDMRFFVVSYGLDQAIVCARDAERAKAIVRAEKPWYQESWNSLDVEEIFPKEDGNTMHVHFDLRT